MASRHDEVEEDPVWADTETDVDFLNYSEVAELSADVRQQKDNLFLSNLSGRPVKRGHAPPIPGPPPIAEPSPATQASHGSGKQDINPIVGTGSRRNWSPKTPRRGRVPVQD